jgi:cytochrome b561
MVRYNGVARLLHWAMAVLVILMMVMGWWMSGLEEGPVRSQSIRLHKSLGLCLWVLVLVRLYWRQRHPPPPLPASVAAFEVSVSGWVHQLLYGLLVLQPTLGYLSASFSGYPMRWFGLTLPGWGWKDPALNSLFSLLHEATGFVMAGLILLHAGASLWHGLILRDGVLSRMGFGRSS